MVLSYVSLPPSLSLYIYGCACVCNEKELGWAFDGEALLQTRGNREGEAFKRVVSRYEYGFSFGYLSLSLKLPAEATAAAKYQNLFRGDFNLLGLVLNFQFLRLLIDFDFIVLNSLISFLSQQFSSLRFSQYLFKI